MGIDKQKYVAKIASATSANLVVINFEIILDYLKESTQTINNQKDFEFNISKARQFLTELRCSLNMQYEISSYLLTMYNYVDRYLAKFLFSKNLNDLDEAQKVLKNIMSAFVEIENKNSDNTKVMENTDAIYAGLTYNKNGTLCEFVDIKDNKGFKA